MAEGARLVIAAGLHREVVVVEEQMLAETEAMLAIEPRVIGAIANGRPESTAFPAYLDKLAKSGLLYLVTEKFANIDLHPDVVSNNEMGAVFEELIRKFAELSNETAGEHFTPREVIRLMVNLLFIEDDAALTQPCLLYTSRCV